MTEIALKGRAAQSRTGLQRFRDWAANPWGRPRFLVLVTWLYVLTSILPVIIAIQFSFNSGRSVTAWQGFSLSRWYWSDPVDSVWHGLLGSHRAAVTICHSLYGRSRRDFLPDLRHGRPAGALLLSGCSRHGKGRVAPGRSARPASLQPDASPSSRPVQGGARSGAAGG